MKDEMQQRLSPDNYIASAELTDRQREILRLIVRHYVLTANPVGSRYLARVSSLGLKRRHDAEYHGGPGIHGVCRSSAHERGPNANG